MNIKLADGNPVWAGAAVIDYTGERLLVVRHDSKLDLCSDVDLQVLEQAEPSSMVLDLSHAPTVAELKRLQKGAEDIRAILKGQEAILEGE